MQIVAIPPAENVVFLQVGWDVYQTLVRAVGESSKHRFAYDGETLEIMSPSPAHEEYIRLLEKLLGFYSREKRIKIQSVGSFTMVWEPRGAEPDSSYYIRNAAAIVGKKRIDFAVDPPPDLVLEVDISGARLDKFKIYAAMRIPEYWRYDGNQLRAYELGGDVYAEINSSRLLKGLLVSDINRFMEMRYATDQSTISDLWCDWLHH